MHIANTIDMCMLDDSARNAPDTRVGPDAASRTHAHPASRADDDRRLLEHAEASLKPLIHHAAVASHAVESAQIALLALRDRARLARERCARARARRAAGDAARAALDEHQRRVDGGIIDARVRMGDARMVRDALARDVARARRRVEESEREDGAEPAGEAALYGPAQEVKEQGEMAALRGALVAERRQMEQAETQLQHVADDITRIRWKRAELRRLMKDAEREW